MKKNWFKNFYKILLGASLASVCFFATGCADALGGKVFDEIENAINSGEISKEEGDSLKEDYSGGLQLDGIKVLRRPSEYNYDDNVIAGADYYYNFAKDVFFTFYRTYGILNATGYYSREEAPGDDIFEALYNVKVNDGTSWLKDVFANEEHVDRDKLKYYYDAIRYQITNEENIPEVPDDPETPENESQEAYVVVTANINNGWNWVRNYDDFKYNVPGIQVFVYSNSRAISSPDVTQFPLIKNNYETLYDEDHDLNEKSFSLTNVKESYYENQALFSASTYSSTFVNNDFIYTLAYAIYCKVLNVPVNNAGYNSSGKWIVEGYEGADEDNPATEGDERTSSYQAYLYMQNQFKKLGSYVGLTQKNKDAIKEYILNTVIGESAQNYGLQNLYYDDIVDAVVEYCGKLTTIGKTSDEGDDERTPVGDSFIASEVLDFPSTGFFVSSNDEDEFESISANEYQSIVLMPSVDEFKVSDLWLDFKYVAKDKNGNEIDDDSLFIKIYVQIRWWTGSELKTVGQEITVYNGVVDVGEDNTTMTFEFDEKKKSQNARGDYNSFGEAVTIGKFDCDALNVEDHADKTDPVSGFDVMTVKGQNDSRHYYDVVNSSYNTGFGSYGVLKTSKFEGQSYLEITFDVEKKSNDGNYEFYVGLSKLGYHPSALETYEGV